MRGLSKLSTREEENQKVERERSEGSKYGSFEFWPGRQIGSASETQHMKRGNLGDFSICHRGSLYKWNYHPCAQPPTPLSIAFQESSICPAVCLSFQLVISVFSYILHLYLWGLSHPQLPLSHLFSSPCVNLFLFFLSIPLPLSQFFSLPLARNPSLGSFGGGMRCFNESVLSSSLEGGQWLMQEGGESTYICKPT